MFLAPLLFNPTGLVYLSNGRYFDPVLDLPLQPNPAGGAPPVPQSLNRYAATSLGPVGVAEATVNGGDHMSQILSYGSGVGTAWLSEHYSPAVGQALAGLLPRTYSRSITQGMARFTVKMLKTEVGNSDFVAMLSASKGHIYSQPFPWYNRANRYTSVSITIPVEGDIAGETERMAGRFARFGPVEEMSWRIRGSRLIPDPINPGQVKAFTKLAGVGLDVLVNAGFQVYEDWDNPYLTGGQKIGRSAVSGIVGGLTSLVIVEALGVAGCTASLGCGIIGGIIGSTIWAFGQPFVFEAFPELSEPPRNLRPLP